MVHKKFMLQRTSSAPCSIFYLFKMHKNKAMYLTWVHEPHDGMASKIIELPYLVGGQSTEKLAGVTVYQVLNTLYVLIAVF